MAFGAVLLAGCASEPAALHTVEKGPFRHVITERGTIGSEQEYKLAAPYPAKIDTLLPEGTLVKPGQAVATLGTDEHQDRWERARLDLKQKQLALPLASEKARFEAWRLAREVEKAKLDRRIARLKLALLVEGRPGAEIVDAAETIGTLEAERQVLAATLPEAEALFDKGYLAEEELRRMRDRMRAITAELQAARARLAVLEAGPRQEEIALERLKVEQAASALAGAKKKLHAARVAGELDVETARLQRDRAAEEEAYRARDVARGTITTPVAGVVIHESVWNGAEIAKIKAGDSLRSGSGLVTISDPARQVVRAKVLESAAARLMVGMAVNCRFDAYSALAIAGTVQRIAPVAGPRLDGDMVKVPAIEVQVRLSRPDPRLRPGMSANLEFVIAEEPDRLTVPSQAIAPGPSVQVFERGRLVTRPVTLGRANERVTVVLSGLAPGEKVALPAGGAR